MKNYPILIFPILAFLIISAPAYGQTNLSQFTGLWAFDSSSTKPSRDIPEKLKEYRMLVAVDQDRLMIKSQVVGPVEVRIVGTQGGSSGVMTNNSSRTSTAGSYGVMATGSTSISGESTAGSANYGGSLALYFTARDITFDLSGKEVKVDPPPGDKVNGPTRLRAKVSKDGNTIELTAIRRMTGPRGEAETTTRDTWQIAKDGQSLKFHRQVETPVSRDQLTFLMVRSGQ